MQTTYLLVANPEALVALVAVLGQHLVEPLELLAKAILAVMVMAHIQVAVAVLELAH